MKELDRSGELLALCYRQQWEKATKFLEDENVTATTVSSALHQAVVDSREETLLFLLETARSELLKVNTSPQKDGKTLLHLALEGANLRVIRALLAAGADVAVPDKRNVKPMDIMTWTAVVHPAIMVPLQDDLLHLEQRNACQREFTKALDETTDSVQCKVHNLLERAQEAQEGVAAARAFRSEVNAQICRAQNTDRDLEIQIQAEEVKLQWIRDEVARLHTQNKSADLEVAEINNEAQRLIDASAAFREIHERQQQARANVAGQVAIKCETVRLLRQFPNNEALQTRSLRALVVMCKKPKVRHQLLVNGIQDVLVAVLEQFLGRESIHVSVCQLVVLLSSTAKAMKPWRSQELVKLLIESCKSIKNPASFDDFFQMTLDVLKCLKEIPDVNNIDARTTQLETCGTGKTDKRTTISCPRGLIRHKNASLTTMNDWKVAGRRRNGRTQSAPTLMRSTASHSAIVKIKVTVKMAVESIAAVPLVGKKLMARLGGVANESAAAEVSAFARRQMEKMGWSQGKGLGKREQGVVSHVKVKRREELQGVGAEKAAAQEQQSQWWYNVYDRMASKIQVDASDDEQQQKKQKKKHKKDKKRKRDKDQTLRAPTDEELFAATGGKLFGRRAYGSCNGKLKRDELQLKKRQESVGSDTDESDRQRKKARKEKKRLKKEKKSEDAV